jgi:hypothetical protein
MRVGTKSVIFGVHAVWIHPFFVAWAWYQLNGFPWDFRLWVAFFVHDAGYLFKRDMEGFDGQRHVLLGGRIMGWLFDAYWRDFLLPFEALGKARRQKVLKALLGGQARVRLDPRMALPPHGTVER